MPYVSQNDILAYIASVDNFTQGTTKTFTLTLFKDFINNQLDASQIDSISVVLYDSIQLKKFEYSKPRIIGRTDAIAIGSTSNNTQGQISFTVTSLQSSAITSGALYAEITIVYNSYYPSGRTYVLPYLQIATILQSN